jgi:ribosomal protein S18 acetylase RimI-like enzyme
MKNGFRCLDVKDLVEIHEGIVIRKMQPEETDLLKKYLYEAIFIPEGAEPPARDIVERPELKLYYEGFGSGRADHCLVAEADGRIIGAVWTRIMNDYGHVDDETPSFAISLLSEYRGQGIGTRLMRKMLSLLKEKGCRKASLAVQKANYAVGMYKNVGFEIMDENDEEYIMVCRLSGPGHLSIEGPNIASEDGHIRYHYNV